MWSQQQNTTFFWILIHVQSRSNTHKYFIFGLTAFRFLSKKKPNHDCTISSYFIYVFHLICMRLWKNMLDNWIMNNEHTFVTALMADSAAFLFLHIDFKHEHVLISRRWKKKLQNKMDVSTFFSVPFRWQIFHSDIFNSRCEYAGISFN